MQGLLQVCPLELMRLWGELVQAYHGVNSYGGAVAELYAYRFMPYQPTAHTPSSEHSRETELYKTAVYSAQLAAGEALRDLCALFAKEYFCKVLIDGEMPGCWWTMAGKSGRFGHRAHVEVVHTKETHDQPCAD